MVPKGRFTARRRRRPTNHDTSGLRSTCRTLAYLASWLMLPGRLSKATPHPHLRAEGLGSSLAVFSIAAVVAVEWCRTAARAGEGATFTTDAVSGGTKVLRRVKTPECAGSRNWNRESGT